MKKGARMSVRANICNGQSGGLTAKSSASRAKNAMKKVQLSHSQTNVCDWEIKFWKTSL
jgi:hypothetical protein